jgi:hypothetical protein
MSLMNAFSSLGGAVADTAGAGIKELQRADTLNTLQQGQQQFTGQQNDLNRAASVNLEKMRSGAAQDLARLVAQQQEAASTSEMKNLRSGATAQTSAIGVAAEIAKLREAAALANDADTPEIKLLRETGGLPARNARQASPSPARTGAASGQASPAFVDSGSFTDADTPLSGGGSSSSASTTGNATGGGPDLTNPLVRKGYGRSPMGSDEDLKYSIRSSLDTDPLWANASDNEKNIETAKQFQVISGKLGAPEDLDAMADAIAHYKLPVLTARAAMMEGGPKLVASVLKKNPDFNDTIYDTVKETQKSIVPGGNNYLPIQAMETSLGHADHFLKIAQQLGNSQGGNWVNIFPNKIAKNTGQYPLVNALQMTAYAMAEEGNRIYAGNAGTQDAINHWYEAFPLNGSLADQVAAMKNFAQLMGDKFATAEYNVNKVLSQAGLPKAELLSPRGQEIYDRLINMGPDGKPKKTTSSDDSGGASDTASAPGSYLTPQQMYGGTGPTPTRKPLSAFMPQ